MTCKAENILPYDSSEGKSMQIARMFNAIAGAYDGLNRTLSLGFDRSWRRKGTAFLRPYSPSYILDLATGTGDLAIDMCKTLHPQRIIAADISENMMAKGLYKTVAAGYDDIISFEYQDCMSLTYNDNTFDAVTAAFGIRNFENIERGLSEMYRVLKPGGYVVILELSSPTKFPLNRLYNLYSGTLIPAIGRLVSHDKKAYNYLPASVKAVPQGEDMECLLSRQGFAEVSSRTFTFGVCSLYTGTKQQSTIHK